jgi:uncharacterized membrane protein YphA (DoxX/SURF4 family)
MFEVADNSVLGRYATKPRGAKAVNITFMVLQVLLATAFLVAGATKLAGAAMQVEAFEKIAMGQWFRYATGGVEVLFAILLLFPGTALFAATMLVGTMSAAVVIHLLVIGGSPGPAIVLLTVSAAVVWYRGMYV